MISTEIGRRSGAKRKSRASQPPPPASMWVRVKRRFLQSLVLSGVVLVLLGAGRGGLILLNLPVERIAISGAGRNVSTETVESLVAPRIRQGFLAVNLSDIQTQLEALPWVYKVNIRRRWPNTIAIAIDEQRPIARWGSEGFLNHEGHFFVGEMSAQWQHLPRLEGPEGSQDALVAQYRMVQSLFDHLDVVLVHLAQNAIGQLSVTLDSGTVLMLGSGSIVERTQRFAHLHQHYLHGKRVARIDLRYEHGAAVQLLDPQVARHLSTLEGIR